MRILTLRWLAKYLVVSLSAGAAALTHAADASEIILPSDPRFDVFEMSNSAGGGAYASPVGTVLLTFVSKDGRYCRSARFPADRSVVLACRGEQGWTIEATSDLSRAQATTPTNLGGGYMQEVGEGIQALMASVEPMGESEIIEAASKGWRDPVPVDDSAFDARDILRKTAVAYMTSRSYIDTGTVQTVYTSPSREWTGETVFETAYVAPHDFRFESTMRDFPGVEAHYIAWRDQDGVDAWYNLDPDFEKGATTIHSILDSGAGISRDTSGMVPGLIIRGTKLGGDIVKLADPVRLDDETIDGAYCFQVQGTRWPHKGPTRVWIDKESFLIRKIYEEDELPDATTKTTWTYKPEINVPVGEDALRFAKPQT